MSPFLVFLILLNAYLLLIFVLVKTKAMQRFNMALFGPALMIKTERGRGLLDWFAKARRTFDYGAGFGVYLSGALMVLMSLLLIVQIYFLFGIPVEQTPSPRLILGLPGINPIIPVGFGIIALIFAVVVHEFSHGILARVHNLKVKTMGLLLFIVPIGAFVEPDEEELKATTRNKRLKVFSAGVTSNLFFALVFGIVFSSVLMGQVTPLPGVVVNGIEEGGPAHVAGIDAGDRITSVNSVPIQDRTGFSAEMAKTRPNQTVLLGVAPNVVKNVTTQSCSELYGRDNCTRSAAQGGFGIADADNRSFVGIQVLLPEPVRAQRALEQPFENLPSFLYYIGLPFQALQGQFPLVGPYNEYFVTPFDPATFWFLANLAYWLFWINFMLGATNALPIVPLDGGHMFRDFIGGWLEKRNPTQAPEQRERTVRRVSLWVTFILLFAIVAQFFLPRLVNLFA